MCPKYFTFHEMIASHTAIKNNLVNAPHWNEIVNLKALAFRLDAVREIYGRPITVNSAYRTPEVNKLVGGVPTSYHLRGLAVDITGSHLDELYQAVQQFEWNECFKYNNFIHVAL